MTITLEILPATERQIRDHAARGNVEVVRHLLLEALGPTIETLMRSHASATLSHEAFEALADQLANEFMEYAGPDCPPLPEDAMSREGLYEGHL